MARAILPYLALVALLGNLVERLARAPEDIRAENIRRWASTLEAVTPIGELSPRRRWRVAGVVQTILVDPREGHGYVEATITDGTGTMVARWLGRPALAGMSLGAGLVLEGMCAGEAGGTLTVLNPEYELVPGPEHG